ncbi:MAG: energy-coupling factor ABC transporter ATP-binding protein [Methanoregulaceae archaeon]|nr:energy-coupling factor ABC transporter ATP-binding protein [Methanoregulaceae archaeon]
MQDQPMIEVRDLSFRYPKTVSGRSVTALDRVNLSIARGEIVVISGESGSGKSTFCRCLNGLIPHTQPGTMKGSVVVAGLDTRDHQVCDMARIVGMVFQDPDHQLFSSDVVSEIAFGPEQMGWEPDRIKGTIDRSLSNLGITHLRDRSITALSWGERQRVAIASVMAVDPQVIVLDEPFSGLDASGAGELAATLRRLNDQAGTTVVLTEHRLGKTVDLRARLILFHKGQVIYDGLSPAYEPDKDPGRSGRSTCPETGSGGAFATPAIRLEGIRFSYPGQKTPVLDIRELGICPGRITVIEGPNGCGKSTLLRLLNGVLRPGEGHVFLFGEDCTGRTVAELSRSVGLVSQHADHQLFGETISEELEFGPGNVGMDREAASGRVRTAADQLEITPLGLDTPPLSLSAGEKQRVAIASILAMETQVIVLDEPTIGLDLRLKQVLGKVLCALRDQGRTIVIATHDSDFSGGTADLVIRMDAGRITSTSAVHREPAGDE